jgi:glycosyltransferase involved in cell wall biosynthesis
MTRHDVAIYAPFSRGYYDRARGWSGGAERQMVLLAAALAARGHHVAHIVFPPVDPITMSDPHLSLVHRLPYAGNRPVIGRVMESIRVWRALRAADGRVIVARAGNPAVGITALFAKLHRRRFIFSSANNFDFVAPRISNWWSRAVYGLGVRLADVVVVQSEDQRKLAEQAFPSLRRIEHIPSFVDSVPHSEDHGERALMFLWIGRAAPEKRPLRYLELARALPEAQFAMIPVPEGGVEGVNGIRAAAEGIPNLQLLEPLPHAELMRLVGRAVAVVNTSNAEGMPNVFLEAWARGIPVLTLQFDPDGVVSRQTLGVAAEGSWDRFVAGARELWEGRSRVSDVSRSTREYIDAVHSTEVVGERWSGLIDRLR